MRAGRRPGAAESPPQVARDEIGQLLWGPMYGNTCNGFRVLDQSRLELAIAADAYADMDADMDIDADAASICRYGRARSTIHCHAASKWRCRWCHALRILLRAARDQPRCSQCFLLLFASIGRGPTEFPCSHPLSNDLAMLALAQNSFGPSADGCKRHVVRCRLGPRPLVSCVPCHKK